MRSKYQIIKAADLAYQISLLVEEMQIQGIVTRSDVEHRIRNEISKIVPEDEKNVCLHLTVMDCHSVVPADRTQKRLHTLSTD